MSGKYRGGAGRAYVSRFGPPPYRFGDAVDLVGDDGAHVHSSGLVVRVHNAIVGWRFEVTCLAAGRVYVGAVNLRPCATTNATARQLATVEAL